MRRIVRTAPKATFTGVVLANDTGQSSSDFITKNGAVTFSGTVTPGAATVRIYNGTKLLGAAVVVNGIWTLSTTLAEGTYSNLKVVAADASGLSSSATNSTAIVVDKTPPSLTITSQTLASDTGAGASDLVTSNGAVTLTGTASGHSGTIQIFDGTTLLGTATVGINGDWTFTTTLVDGSYALYAVATDQAGNNPTTATQPTIVVDKSPPALAIASQVLAADTGVSATDLVTSNGAVTLTGTATGLSGTVQIFDGASVLGTAAVNSNGTWTFATTLSDGSHALHAAATDLAGNTTTTAAQSTIVVDTGGPSVAFRYENQVVGSNSVQLYGTVSGPAGTTVEVFSGSIDLGAATINADNSWVFDTPQLVPGNYSFSAVATTTTGKTSSFGGIPSLTVGSASGTIDLSRFSKVWEQDFTHSTQIDRGIFPIVYGNPNDFSFGVNGITLTSNRSEGFANVGFLQPNWGSNLSQGYGLYSVTASHPANQGAGIAILLWPSNNVWPGPEMDILEDWSDPTSQTGYMTVHFKGPGGTDMANTIKFQVDLTVPNTYALDWEQGSLTYFINGREIFQVTGSEVPLDGAHGGVNAAFGAQITDIGNTYQPSDQVSLTVADMSYSVVGPPPAAIRVSAPGTVQATGPGAAVHVKETITGVSLNTTTVYAIVLNANNIAYVDWQPVTLNSSGIGTFDASFYNTGDYLVVTTDKVNQSIKTASATVTVLPAPLGLPATAAIHAAPVTANLTAGPASNGSANAPSGPLDHQQDWLDLLSGAHDSFGHSTPSSTMDGLSINVHAQTPINSSVHDLQHVIANFPGANPASESLAPTKKSFADTIFHGLAPAFPSGSHH